MRQDTAASLAPMLSSSAVVARAADTPLRPVAPGTPYRLAGSALARLVEPSPGVPIAVDLVFSGGASASTCAPVSRPLPAALSHPGCFEYTYVLDGRGSVRLEREKERERAPTTPLACACPTSILVAPSCSLQPLSLSLSMSIQQLRPPTRGKGVRVRAGDSAVSAPCCVIPSAARQKVIGGKDSRGEEESWSMATLTLTIPAEATPACAAAVVAAAAARAAWYESESESTATVGPAAAAAAVAAAHSHARAAVPSPLSSLHSPSPPARRRRAGPTSVPSVRRLADLPAFRMAASNRLALAFDPLRDDVPFTVGVEVFDPGHQTPRHTHEVGCEVFFVLSGTGVGHCNDASFALAPGDVAIFPPTSVHGLDADAGGPLVCLELLCPNDSFAEKVRSGELTGSLADEELCALAAVGCG